MTADAARLWEEVYPKLSEGGQGLLASITDRAEAQTIRLALIVPFGDSNPRLEAKRGADEVGEGDIPAARGRWPRGV